MAFLPKCKCLFLLWLQLPSTVILEPKKIKSVPVSTVSPSVYHEAMQPDAMILVFWMSSFKNQLFHSPVSLSSRGSLVPLCFLPLEWYHLHIWGGWYFSWQSSVPAYDSSSLAFRMMYSAYTLNKQGDNIQPWHTPFLVLNQSIVACPVLTVASWPAYRFLRRQVRWSGSPISFKNFPQFVMIHSQGL